MTEPAAAEPRRSHRLDPIPPDARAFQGLRAGVVSRTVAGAVDYAIIAGVTVGLWLDHSWRSYYTVVDTWTALLERDGAAVRVLWTGDRVGPEGEQTRNDLEEWSRLVEVGVVGLGN